MRPRELLAGACASQACQPRILDLQTQCVACFQKCKKPLPCGRCKAVAYCGRACQKAHWGGHKRFCPVLSGLELAKPPWADAAPEPAQRPRDVPDVFAEEPKGKRTYFKQVTKEGRGPPPDDEAMVRVHYDGYLADGQRMDSSRAKEKPFDFHVSRSGVARGWREAVRTMQTGEKALVGVAPAAAYADRGVPHKVPKHSALVFEVEVLEVW